MIENKSDKLVNYELRRKMRRIGVQLQDLGTRLCWQVFIDNPGENLGLSQMVDLVEAPDTSALKTPDHLPFEPVLTRKIKLPFPYKPVLNYNDTNTPYAYWKTDPVQLPNGTSVGVSVGRSTSDDNDSNIVIQDRIIFPSPKEGYVTQGSPRVVGVPDGKVASVRTIQPAGENSYDVVFERIHFGGQTALPIDWEVSFVPRDTAGEEARVKAANDEADKRFDGEKARLLKRAYLDAIRKRIKDVSGLKSRPAWDLREEERTIIFRKLIERLMLGVWKEEGNKETLRVSHLRSELIRSLFDVDALLYFVAPEWSLATHGGCRVQRQGRHLSV